jgi:hypothetical protein
MDRHEFVGRRVRRVMLAKRSPSPVWTFASSASARSPTNRGANFASTSGQPCAAPQVLLRAPISSNATCRQGGQSSLIVVDGIITIGSMSESNSLDIERIEVLKVAAAASGDGLRDIERPIDIARRHPCLLNGDKTLYGGNRTGTRTVDFSAEILCITRQTARCRPRRRWPVPGPDGAKSVATRA